MTTATEKITIVAYAVVDADAHERFSTTDFATEQRAADRREQLAQKYGKEVCLEVWGVDDRGRLIEL